MIMTSVRSLVLTTVAVAISNSYTSVDALKLTLKTDSDLIASKDAIEERLKHFKSELADKNIEFQDLWGGDSDEAVWKSDWELIRKINFDLNHLVYDVVARTKIINKAEASTNKQKLLIAANDFIMSTFRRNMSLCSSLYVNWYIVLQNFSSYLDEIRLLNSNSSSSDVHSFGNILEEWGYQSAEDVFKHWYEQELESKNRNPFSRMGSNSPLARATQKL